MSFAGTVEVVRGALAGERAEEVLRFWAAQGALTPEAAQDRLPEVVCVLRDGEGAVVGTSSVFADDVALLGGRRLWILRQLLVPATAEAEAAVLKAVHAALEAEFDPAVPGPLGVCLLLSPQEAARRPEAAWTDPRAVYAGHLADGRQVRAAWFLAARVGAPEPAADTVVRQPVIHGDIRVALFAEQSEVDADALVELWTREGVLSPEEARRRVPEALVVATDERGAVVGVHTAYLAHHAQTGVPLWHMRTFVPPAFERTDLALRLSLAGREHLDRRYAGGHDLRAPGMLYEVENEGLKTRFSYAIWTWGLEFTFIGENERGDHVRVHFFPGAPAPQAPAQGST